MIKSLTACFLTCFAVVLSLNTICDARDRDTGGQKIVLQSKDNGLNKEETSLLKRVAQNHQNHSKSNTSTKQFYKTVTSLYISYRSQIRAAQSALQKLPVQKFLSPRDGLGTAQVQAMDKGYSMDLWLAFSDKRDQAKETRAQLKEELSETNVSKIDNYLGIRSDNPDIFDYHTPIEIGGRYYR